MRRNGAGAQSAIAPCLGSYPLNGALGHWLVEKAVEASEKSIALNEKVGTPRPPLAHSESLVLGAHSTVFECVGFSAWPAKINVWNTFDSLG
jgi:hypothetical protein